MEIFEQNQSESYLGSTKLCLTALKLLLLASSQNLGLSNHKLLFHAKFFMKYLHVLLKHTYSGKPYSFHLVSTSKLKIWKST